MENYEFGDIPVAAAVNTPRASVEEIVKLAKEIWGKIAKSGIPPEDDKRNDELLERLQGEHKDFNQSFPIVLRWMVQMRKFRVKSFENYLRRHATADLSSKEKFLELQGDYLVLLFREEHPRSDETMVRRYREQVVKQLIEEDKAFTKIQKDAEEHIEKLNKKNADERRAALYAYLMERRRAEEAGRESTRVAPTTTQVAPTRVAPTTTQVASTQVAPTTTQVAPTTTQSTPPQSSKTE